MRVWFLRHAESTYNRLGLCNDDPAKPAWLTARGVAQAEEAARRLAHVAFDAIYVSRLPRTRQTAVIVRGERLLPIHVHPGLDDIRTGFDSRPVSAYFAATGRDRLHIRPPGGESVLDFKRRVGAFLDWLEHRPHQRVLVVAHEETLRVVIARYRRLDDARMLRLQIANAEWVEFDIGP